VSRRIYLIKDLPPETVAVTFAKTSRSPEPFDEIAAGLTEKKSAKFHKKWVVGYGHSSVAEHAILHIAFEDISIVAAKAIEDNRLSSFTEKSTRFQVYDPERYYHPPGIGHSPLGPEYEKAVHRMMQTYIQGMQQSIAWHTENLPREDGEKDRAFANRCRAKSCDLLRFFLPAGTLTNVGWTVNARQLEYAIGKLLISPLVELREIGEEIRKVALVHVPTLVRYANPNAYLAERKVPQQDLPPALSEERHVGEDAAGTAEVRLVNYDPDGENKVIAGLAYPYAATGYDQLLAFVRGLSVEKKEEMLKTAVGTPRSFDAGPRALETTSYTFEIILDYGAWRDIQRHRLCTQLVQDFTPQLGYIEPGEFAEIGIAEQYRTMRKLSAETYYHLHAEYPADAVYALLLGFRVRTLFDMNLREAYHFARLRSSPHGHASYRKVAVALWEQITKAHPLLARHLPGIHPLEEKPHNAGMSKLR